MQATGMAAHFLYRGLPVVISIDFAETHKHGVRIRLRLSRQLYFGAEFYCFITGHNETPRIQTLSVGKLKPVQTRIEPIPKELEPFFPD